jgi:hypothetical protein
MRLNKGEILNIYETFKILEKKMLESYTTDRFLAYNILENLERLESEAIKLQKIHPNNIAEQFKKENEEKVVELSEKGEDGNPIQVKNEDTGQVTINITDDNKEIYEEFIKNLNERYQRVSEKPIAEFTEICKEEVEIDLKKIKLDALPELELKYIKIIKKLITE